ncbi:hypothetical protein GOBAR_DD13076 [Gossypium barbadense]|nr:hypothetical protein GOBAR_DD13076 [Gossypium barbadense]
MVNSSKFSIESAVDKATKNVCFIEDSMDGDEEGRTKIRAPPTMMVISNCLMEISSRVRRMQTLFPMKTFSTSEIDGFRE